MQEPNRNTLKVLIRETLKETLMETIGSLPPKQVIGDVPARIDGTFSDFFPDTFDSFGVAVTCQMKGHTDDGASSG